MQNNIVKQTPSKNPARHKKGDIVIIDFEGFIGKEPIEGGAAKGHSLEIGSGSFIPGFEDQLVGQDSGSHVKVKVTFPEAYHDDRYANKAAIFDVSINEIHEADPLVIDKELATKIGFKSLEEMKEWVEKSISKDYESQSFLNTKRHVLDSMAERFKFDVPRKHGKSRIRQYLETAVPRTWY